MTIQPNEIWRRGVIMPHTAEVVQQINDGDIDDSVAVDYLPINCDVMFASLWDMGLFETINTKCGTLIDDYESAWLLPEHFPVAAMIVTQLLKNNSQGDIGYFLSQLLAMIDKATKAKMPLYFEC